MYSGEDGEAFVELGYIGKNLSASKAKQPDKSRVGGKPAWFGEAPVPHEQLVCRLCGRDLFLVAQVYAPTHVLRSLCVFGCNRAACSASPQGWRVIRTQQPQRLRDDSTPASSKIIPSQTSSTINTIPETAVAPARPITDKWTDACRADAPSRDEGGGGGDDWGDEGGEGDWGETAVGGDGGIGVEGLGEAELSTAAIDALLTEQEKRSSKQIADRLGKVNDRLQNSTIESNTTMGNDHERTQTAWDVMEPKNAGENNEADALTVSPQQLRYSKAKVCFPVNAIDFSPEPWGADLSSDKDLDMENRIRRYREQEEDRNLIAALDQALEVGNNGARSKPGTVSTAPGTGEKYERTPARAKAVLRFAERVARAPQQIVRYAYGGMPLWSASDPPKDNIPPCKCGSARVFEMQLMPALLLRLPVNAFAEPGKELSGKIQVHATVETTVGDDQEVAQSQKTQKCEVFDERESSRRQESPIDDNDDPVGDGMGGEGSDDEEGGGGDNVPPAPSADDRERLRTWGMDWGVVTVWCCPRSCNLSYEETVVVQPPI